MHDQSGEYPMSIGCRRRLDRQMRVVMGVEGRVRDAPKTRQSPAREPDDCVPSMCSESEILFDEGVERGLVAGTRALIDHFTPAEDDDRGNAANAVLRCHTRGLVDVVLGNDRAAVEGLGRLFKARGEHAAGPAPRGPEVDEDGGFGVDDFGEVGVGDVKNFAHDVLL